MTNRKRMGISGRAVARIDEQVHRRAEAISQMAHRAADQLDRASGYIQKQCESTRAYAVRASELASKHPAYLTLAIGAVGFGLGFAMRGHEAKTVV